MIYISSYDPLLFQFKQHQMWLISSSDNLPWLMCCSESRPLQSAFQRMELWRSITFLVKGRIIIISVGSWRQHLSFPLFVLPLEPCDWPQRQSVSFWAGLEPAVAALVQWRKDSCSQRRSKEGKKIYNALAPVTRFPNLEFTDRASPWQTWREKTLGK